jgi:bifunctional ADP-heptose synthase (sugar kinase/adenylyltransferase)
MAKYIHKKDLKNIIEEERKSFVGKKIVFAVGSFDVMTIFDIRYLRDAKNVGDVLVVGVYSDEIIKQKFGEKRPITSFEDRLEILKGVEMIDYLVCVDTEDVKNLIDLINPDKFLENRKSEYDVVTAVLAKCKKNILKF